MHLLVGLRATHCLADVTREVKAGSSKWVYDGIGERAFQWQGGYGGFTVSAPQCPAVGYLGRQEEHHRTRTFQQEYLEFLQRGGVEYDKWHLWLRRSAAPPGWMFDWARGPMVPFVPHSTTG